MAKALPIQLGVQATDSVSGIKGIVTCRLDQINGNTQWAIQPKGKGDNQPDGHFFDVTGIVVTGKGLSDKVTPAQESKVRLGDQIKSRATEEIGIAYERLTFMNGCVNYTCKMTAKPGKKAEVFSCMTPLIEIIGDGISIETSKPTGGPSQSMRGYSSR